MIPLKMILVGLPSTVWERMPRDRPLSEVAKDAEGAARRIQKGSNVLRERLRFNGLCLYAESVALDLLQRKSASQILVDRVLLSRLTSITCSDGSPSGTSLAQFHVDVVPRDCTLATIYPPGSAIESLRTEYERLSMAFLKTANPKLSEETLAPYANSAAEATSLLRGVEAARGAAIRVFVQA